MQCMLKGIGILVIIERYEIIDISEPLTPWPDYHVLTSVQNSNLHEHKTQICKKGIIKDVLVMPTTPHP